MNRRSFLRSSALALSGVAAIAAALEPLRDLNDYTSVQKFFQKHYKELTPQEMEKILTRIADEVEKQYKIRPHVKDYKPMNGVEANSGAAIQSLWRWWSTWHSSIMTTSAAGYSDRRASV